MRGSWVLRGAAALLLCSLFVAAPAGAATTSRMTGVVVDNQEVALPGVTVMISSDVLIGGEQVAVTDADGAFAFNLLPPGLYTVRADMPGFTPAETQVKVSLDRTAHVQIQLVLQEFADEIQVVAEAPVVDTSQVTTGEVFSQEYLENAAVGIGGRDYLSIIGQSAGVVGTGNVNVYGSVGSDNVYLVDGFNTTDPVTATFGTNFNFDAIQEVSIQTGGFEAEFGQAMGGVVNLVTKSGGNEFDGAVDLRYRDEGFSESGDYFDPDQNVSSLRQVSGTLGGPILQDAIWFFASVENAFSERTPEGAPVTREFDNWNYLAKVTWQATDATRAVVKLSGDPAEVANWNTSQFITPDAAAFQDQGGTIAQGEIDSVLSSSLLLTAGVGITRGGIDGYPASGDVDTVSWLNRTTGVRFNNYNNAQYSDRDTDQARAHLSWFVNDLAGSHEIKTGVEYRSMFFRGNNFRTGDMELQVLENPNYLDLNEDGYTDYILYQDLPLGAGREYSESDGELYSLFVQDAWRPMAGVTVKPGVRLDTASYDNQLGQTVADFSSVQPRFGVAWDVTGNGKHVLRANWGRFMHPGSVNLADTVSGRAVGTSQLVGYEYWCSRGLCDEADLADRFGDPYTWTDPQGRDHVFYPYVSYGTDPFQSIDTLGVGSLEEQYADQLIVAFETQLWEQTSLELSYVDKQTESLIEDVCSNQTWVWGDGSAPSLDDPSTWTDPDGCANYVLANVPGLKRDYQGVIAKFESRYQDWLHVLASYTWSKSEGNTDAQANRSYASGGYDEYPRDFFNYYGYLGDDRRHRVKLSGFVMLPHDIIIGADGFWSSEPALDFIADCGDFAAASAEEIAAAGVDPALLAYCNGAASGDLYLEPRGNRRGSSNWQMDVQATKGFNFGALRLEAVAAIVNLIGSERAIDYEEYVFAGDEWGTVLDHQDPRRYELGLRFEF